MRKELVEWREAKGLTPEQLALKLDINVRTIYRMEAGRTAPRMELRSKLASFYGRSLGEVNRAIRGTLNGHKVTRLGHLASLEQSAAEIWTFETTVCAGLLQTESYARVVESVAPDLPSPEEIDRRVAQRMRRQQVLTKNDPLRLMVLLDASVLQRVTGGPAVMAEQLDHLHKMAEMPHIAVRLLPLDARAHAGGRGAFWLVTPPDDDLPFMAVTDTAAGIQYFDSDFAVAAHVELWNHLWSISDALA